MFTNWSSRGLVLCLAEPDRIIATSGANESLQTTDRVWPVKVNAKSGRPLYCLYSDLRPQLLAGRLYRETIQRFDPKRHRPFAPAIYLGTDTGYDYFHELMQEHEVWKNRKTIWENVSQSAVNDFGDCEKIEDRPRAGLVRSLSRESADYVLRPASAAPAETLTSRSDVIAQ